MQSCVVRGILGINNEYCGLNVDMELQKNAVNKGPCVHRLRMH